MRSPDRQRFVGAAEREKRAAAQGGSRRRSGCRYLRQPPNEIGSRVAREALSRRRRGGGAAALRQAAENRAFTSAGGRDWQTIGRGRGGLSAIRARRSVRPPTAQVA